MEKKKNIRKFLLILQLLILFMFFTIFTTSLYPDDITISDENLGTEAFDSNSIVDIEIQPPIENTEFEQANDFTLNADEQNTEIIIDDINDIPIVIFEDTVETELGQGAFYQKPYPFIAIGAKAGFTMSGMFTNDGIIMLPGLSDGSIPEITSFEQGYYLQSAQIAYVYMTFVDQIQMQIEFGMAVFKGIKYDVTARLLDADGTPTGETFGDQSYSAYISLLYFEIPILFRWEPDLYKWTNTPHLDFYLTVGPTILILERAVEKMFRIDRGSIYSDEDRYITAESYFAESLPPYDVSMTVALGYTLKDIIPYIDPVFEVKADFSVLDVAKLGIGDAGASARNWTVYFLIGLEWSIFDGTIF